MDDFGFQLRGRRFVADALGSVLVADERGDERREERGERREERGERREERRRERERERERCLGGAGGRTFNLKTAWARLDKTVSIQQPVMEHRAKEIETHRMLSYKVSAFRSKVSQVWKKRFLHVSKFLAFPLPSTKCRGKTLPRPASSSRHKPRQSRPSWPCARPPRASRGCRG